MHIKEINIKNWVYNYYVENLIKAKNKEIIKVFRKYNIYKNIYKLKNILIDKKNDEDIVGVEKFDNTKILIGTEDELPDNITFKNVVILMTCVIKDGNKFYP